MGTDVACIYSTLTAPLVSFRGACEAHCCSFASHVGPRHHVKLMGWRWLLDGDATGRRAGPHPNWPWLHISTVAPHCA